jgi:hypothetical protein
MNKEEFISFIARQLPSGYWKYSSSKVEKPY